MCDGKAIEDLNEQIEVLTEERDDWHQKYVGIVSRITPKGGNVPGKVKHERRVKNKAARAARRRNRRG